MNIQVVNNNNVPMTNSKDVADHFDKGHRTIYRKIDELMISQPEFSVANFGKSSFVSEQNKTLKCYTMTRDGFSMIAMSLTGDDAEEWKIKYINAFNAMEKKILSQNVGVEWSQARLQIKGVRRSITDTIKGFVEYATNQGSKSANHYYSNITKMEYKALELTQAYKKAKGEKCNFRDALDLMDISFLSAAEWVARNAIQEGMDRELPYKEIYMLTKDRVIAYADTVNIKRLN